MAKKKIVNEGKEIDAFIGFFAPESMKKNIIKLAIKLDRPVGWICKDALRNYGPLQEVIAGK